MLSIKWLLRIVLFSVGCLYLLCSFGCIFRNTCCLASSESSVLSFCSSKLKQATRRAWSAKQVTRFRWLQMQEKWCRRQRRGRDQFFGWFLFLWLFRVLVAYQEGITVTVLKYLLFTRKKPEMFAKFVKKGVVYRSNEVLIFMRRVAAESDTSLTPCIISTLFLRSLRCSRSCA